MFFFSIKSRQNLQDYFSSSFLYSKRCLTVSVLWNKIQKFFAIYKYKPLDSFSWVDLKWVFFFFLISILCNFILRDNESLLYWFRNQILILLIASGLNLPLVLWRKTWHFKVVYIKIFHQNFVFIYVANIRLIMTKLLY